MLDLALRTERLALVATTLAHIEAELVGREALAALLGVTIGPEWPPGEHDRDALEFFRERLAAGGPPVVGWYGWYACAGPLLVGAAGYLGPPSDGAVEIGYSMIPSARGRGYATEVVRALVVRAFEVDEVERVVARTSDANAASTRVLLNAGFERAGAGAEPETVIYRILRARRPPESRSCSSQ